MARLLSLEYERAHYHVTPRGDGREAVFEDDGGGDAFLRLLGEDEGTADYLRIHYATVSRSVRRQERKDARLQDLTPLRPM